MQGRGANYQAQKKATVKEAIKYYLAEDYVNYEQVRDANPDISLDDILLELEAQGATGRVNIDKILCS
ncbi:MAG: hypothetical protein C4555_06425 [Dehalococcoidia bacterium]|nr:MAG: hypothetical protein C4555_06425 [Dehalococcoidia bacterium]